MSSLLLLLPQLLPAPLSPNTVGHIDSASFARATLHVEGIAQGTLLDKEITIEAMIVIVAIARIFQFPRHTTLTNLTYFR